MPALDEQCSARLAQLEMSGLRRILRDAAGKPARNFSSNDYFSLRRHSKVIEAAIAALEAYGNSASASRLVTGNHPLFAQLEADLAAYKKTEAALIFGSGYLANLGVITALMGKHDLILSDKLAHACLLDAVQLSSAAHRRFAHNDMAHLRQLLQSHRANHACCLIITESIFSMDGDHAPLAELAALAADYDAWLLCDDAHGLGFADCSAAAIQTGTLSKGLASYGGYVCGSQILIDYLVTTARSFIFSTGLPPATIAAAQAALGLIKTNPYAEQALANAQLFTAALSLPKAQGPIVPVIIGEPEAALAASRVLEEAGFIARAIRPPTVPPHTARLRFTFQSGHQENDILKLVEVVKQYV